MEKADGAACKVPVAWRMQGVVEVLPLLRRLLLKVAVAIIAAKSTPILKCVILARVVAL